MLGGRLHAWSLRPPRVLLQLLLLVPGPITRGDQGATLEYYRPSRASRSGPSPRCALSPLWRLRPHRSSFPFHCGEERSN